jgi:hypothetical protein
LRGEEDAGPEGVDPSVGGKGPLGGETDTETDTESDADSESESEIGSGVGVDVGVGVGVGNAASSRKEPGLLDVEPRLLGSARTHRLTRGEMSLRRDGTSGLRPRHFHRPWRSTHRIAAQYRNPARRKAAHAK